MVFFYNEIKLYLFELPGAFFWRKLGLINFACFGSDEGGACLDIFNALLHFEISTETICCFIIFETAVTIFSLPRKGFHKQSI